MIWYHIPEYTSTLLCNLQTWHVTILQNSKVLERNNDYNDTMIKTTMVYYNLKLNIVSFEVFTAATVHVVLWDATLCIL